MLNDQWGTIAVAAAMLDVSPKTIRRMITRGEIEAKRFGPRLVRVNLARLSDSGRPMQYLGGDA